MDRMDMQTLWTVRAGDHSTLKRVLTVIEDGEADEPVGIDMFVIGWLSQEDDFR